MNRRQRMFVRALSLAAIFSAVSISAANLAVGAKGGLSLSGLWGSYAEDGGFGGTPNMRPGFVAGVLADLRLTDLFGLQPELLYGQKGQNFNRQDDTSSIEHSLRLSYLQVPVLVKMVFAHRLPVKPTVYAGPFLAINTLADLKGVENGQRIQRDISAKSIDFGTAFGGGLEIKAGDFNVILDLRYSLGFTPVYSAEADQPKTRSLSVAAGIAVWL